MHRVGSEDGARVLFSGKLGNPIGVRVPADLEQLLEAWATQDRRAKSEVARLLMEEAALRRFSTELAERQHQEMAK